MFRRTLLGLAGAEVAVPGVERVVANLWGWETDVAGDQPGESIQAEIDQLFNYQTLVRNECRGCLPL